MSFFVALSVKHGDFPQIINDKDLIYNYTLIIRHLVFYNVGQSEYPRRIKRTPMPLHKIWQMILSTLFTSIFFNSVCKIFIPNHHQMKLVFYLSHLYTFIFKF